jgi:N-acetylmuramoyl-L-alanine amidase
MKILSHKLHGSNISFQQSPNSGKKFEVGSPDTLIIHYTGGRSLSSSVAWLTNPSARASAHVIIGKNGDIVQLVNFDKVAWHAGKSEWKGRSGLNQYSIGIELDNAGRLEKRVDGYYTWFGKRIESSNVAVLTHRHETIPSYWESFTEKQIDVAEQLSLLLCRKYNIQEILGHEDVSPGRKVDPGPAFPLDRLRNLITAEDRSSNDKPDIDQKKHSNGVVIASLLNMRDKPSTESGKVIMQLPVGTDVNIMQEKGQWCRVSIEGWVSRQWLRSKL